MQDIAVGFDGNKFVLADYSKEITQILCDFESYYENFTPFSIEAQRINFHNLIDATLVSSCPENQKSMLIVLSALLCRFLSHSNKALNVAHIGGEYLDDIFAFLTEKYRENNQYITFMDLQSEIWDIDVLLYNCENQESMETFIKDNMFRIKNELQLIFYGNIRNEIPQRLQESEYFDMGDGDGVIIGKINVGKYYYSASKLQIRTQLLKQIIQFNEDSLLISKLSFEELKQCEFNFEKDDSKIYEAIKKADQIEKMLCINAKLFSNPNLRNEINEVKNALLDLEYVIDNQMGNAIDNDIDNDIDSVTMDFIYFQDLILKKAEEFGARFLGSEKDFSIKI